MIIQGFSGIGVLVSGIPYQSRGTVPTLTPAYYNVKTENYQIPVGPYINGIVVGISSKDEKTSSLILENTLLGISRVHTSRQNTGVLIEGNYADFSDYRVQNLIIGVSGIGGYISNIFVGNTPGIYAWSGLSATGTNYLWMSLVEQSNTNAGYLSSRQYNQFECRSTTDGNAPVGPEGSMLVATYTSGTGVNSNPYGKPKLGMVGDHVANNTNPHRDPLNNTLIQCSGINVLGYNIWNYNATSGMAPSGIPFNNLTYLNQLTIDGNIFRVSGINGNIQSGNLFGTFFSGFQNLFVDPGNIGVLNVTSGVSISGATFNNNIILANGVTIGSSTNGLAIVPITLSPLLSHTCLSGNPKLHYHALNDFSGINVNISPKYFGATFNPPVVLGNGVNTSHGFGSNFAFEYNYDLGMFKPTLRCKSPSPSNVYIRTFVPLGYNRLESVDVTYAIDSGSNPILLNIRDSQGALQTPLLGGVLSSSGILTAHMSGISPSAKFSQGLPLDLEFTLNGISGTNQYLGNIVLHYRAQSS